jgi:hypothetical protein
MCQKIKAVLTLEHFRTQKVCLKKKVVGCGDSKPRYGLHHTIQTKLNYWMLDGPYLCHCLLGIYQTFAFFQICHNFVQRGE